MFDLVFMWCVAKCLSQPTIPGVYITRYLTDFSPGGFSATAPAPHSYATWRGG